VKTNITLTWPKTFSQLDEETCPAIILLFNSPGNSLQLCWWSAYFAGIINFQIRVLEYRALVNYDTAVCRIQLAILGYYQWIDFSTSRTVFPEYIV